MRLFLEKHSLGMLEIGRNLITVVDSRQTLTSGIYGYPSTMDTTVAISLLNANDEEILTTRVSANKQTPILKGQSMYLRQLKYQITTTAKSVLLTKDRGF